MISINNDVSEILEYHRINNQIKNIISICSSEIKNIDGDLLKK